MPQESLALQHVGYLWGRECDTGESSMQAQHGTVSWAAVDNLQLSHVWHSKGIICLCVVQDLQQQNLKLPA